MADKTYTSDSIDVTYNVKRCIHAKECVRGLPQVFDTDKRPWIQPSEASPDALAQVIERCPTGALHYQRKDNGPGETPDTINTLQTVVDGPIYVRGHITFTASDGTITKQDSRVALCRCGASQNKPFCDNSHKSISFSAQDALANNLDRSDNSLDGTGELTVSPSANGPLLLNGEFVLYSCDGEMSLAHVHSIYVLR